MLFTKVAIYLEKPGKLQLPLVQQVGVVLQHRGQEGEKIGSQPLPTAPRLCGVLRGRRRRALQARRHLGRGTAAGAAQRVVVQADLQRGQQGGAWWWFAGKY